MSIARGEVFAFPGPNGAGKATTVRVLCTLARPTGGTATVAGFDVVRQPRAVRRRIGLGFRERTLDERLTAEQNLRFHAVVYHVPRAGGAADRPGADHDPEPGTKGPISSAWSRRRLVAEVRTVAGLMRRELRGRAA